MLFFGRKAPMTSIWRPVIRYSASASGPGRSSRCFKLRAAATAAAQQRAILFGKRIGGARAEFQRPPSIGFEIGEIDGVHRRARHCADSAKDFRHCKPRRKISSLIWLARNAISSKGRP